MIIDVTILYINGGSRNTTIEVEGYLPMAAVIALTKYNLNAFADLESMLLVEVTVGYEHFVIADSILTPEEVVLLTQFGVDI